MASNNEFDPNIIKQLRKLQTNSTRDPQKSASGRATFLQEASEIAGSVTQINNRRHKNWNQKDQSQFLTRRKEYSPMLSTFASIMIALSLLLGGSGVTVAAAQASQPGDLLYNIKLLSENTLMDLTANPDSQLNLALDLVDRRANEIQELLIAGEIPTEETQTRYRDQIEQAIILALNLPEDKVVPAFEKIQTRLQSQIEMLSQTRTNGSENAIAAMTQTREMVQERLQILENGQNNLLQIQEQLRIQDQIGNPDQQNSSSPNTQESQEAPGTGNGNPWTTGTPTPGSSYGPGESNNPWTTGTPTPGSGYGPGDGTGDCNTCTPVQGGNMQSTVTPRQGAGNGSGPQSTTVPGGQGGNH